jgi:hypothetical protein
VRADGARRLRAIAASHPCMSARVLCLGHVAQMAAGNGADVAQVPAVHAKEGRLVYRSLHRSDTRSLYAASHPHLNRIS